MATLLLLSLRAHQAVPMGGGRCLEEMRNSTRLSLSCNTSVMSMESPKYCWRSAAHLGQRRRKCSAVSSSVPQWGQIGDVICPIKAWYEAVDVSLLSLSWWIALCACRGTPGGILELSWPLQHLKCQFAVPVGLLWVVFSNSSYINITCSVKLWTEQMIKYDSQKFVISAGLQFSAMQGNVWFICCILVLSG